MKNPMCLSVICVWSALVAWEPCLSACDGVRSGLTLHARDSSTDEPLRIAGMTMGSHYVVVVDSPGSANAALLKRDIEGCFDAINRQMSNWDQSSEISRFNESTSTDWFPVSANFAVVAAEAVRLHTLTDGALDPTLAPLIEAWGFGVRKEPVVPSDEVIAAAMTHVGLSRLEVRADPPAVRKSIPGLQLNLSALAPGFAADEVSRLLTERGLAAHVVDVGGENRAGAAKHGGDPWRLGVESPLGGLYKVVEVTDLSIATSGDYRNFHVINGTAYSHILDPRTGRPVADPPACVSVLHRSCMTADGLATAMMVLGSKRGMELAARLELDVMFLDVSGTDGLTESRTGRFAVPPLEAESE